MERDGDVCLWKYQFCTLLPTGHSDYLACVNRTLSAASLSVFKLIITKLNEKFVCIRVCAIQNQLLPDVVDLPLPSTEMLSDFQGPGLKKKKNQTSVLSPSFSFLFFLFLCLSSCLCFIFLHFFLPLKHSNFFLLPLLWLKCHPALMVYRSSQFFLLFPSPLSLHPLTRNPPHSLSLLPDMGVRSSTVVSDRVMSHASIRRACLINCLPY